MSAIGVVKKMPENCFKCPERLLKPNEYDDLTNYCKVADEKKLNGHSIFAGRPLWCPLVSIESEVEYTDNGDGTFTESVKEVNTGE